MREAARAADEAKEVMSTVSGDGDDEEARVKVGRKSFEGRKGLVL